MLRSSGEVRRNWIGAGKTELENLTNTNTVTRLSPQQRDEIKSMACSWLVFFACIFPIDTCLSATSVHRSDDSKHESPLPLLNTCTHSTFSIGASLLMSTCILSIDACLCATCVRELDDSSHVSPLHLLTICMQSTFSLGACACHLFDICCVLTFATCMDAARMHIVHLD